MGELQGELKRDPKDAEIAVRAEKKKDERKAEAALDKERAAFAKKQMKAKGMGFAKQGLAWPWAEMKVKRKRRSEDARYRHPSSACMHHGICRPIPGLRHLHLRVAHALVLHIQVIRLIR